MEASMEQFEEHEISFFVVDRVNRTMAALIAIANYLKELPGAQEPGLGLGRIPHRNRT